MGGLPPVSLVSPLVAAWVPRIAGDLGARAQALDLAMGTGRHAMVLAEAGFETFGVDVSFERVHAANAHGRARRLRLHTWVADLDTCPLPRHRFDLLVCTRFLLRARWADVRELVRPGGFVIYETFVEAQAWSGAGSRSPAHLLRPGELESAFAGWDVLVSDEERGDGAHAGPGGAPVARLVARRPAQRSGS